MSNLKKVYKNFGLLELLVSFSLIYVISMLIWTATTRDSVEAKANEIKFNHKQVVEFMNERYDPFDLKLTGWSESIHENLDEYKDIFAELHEKYKTKTKTPPEIRLLISVFGSAFMFHFSQTVLKLGVNNLGLGGLASMASNMAANSKGNTNAESGINLMQNIMSSNNKNSNKPTNEMQGPSNIDELLKNIEKHNNI